MALNSINTNIAAIAAQGNIGRASNTAGSSIARLSSGNRIVRASDDVAALSAGTSLRTNVTTLKVALINTSQGSSLLQVADGALNQITDILLRQKSIAVQAGSGSLTSSERTFLNQEFQNLTQEVERLSTQTNFNGVSLLDGVLSKKVEAADVTENATRASASLSFSTNAVLGASDRVFINGVTFQGVAAGPVGNQFLIGATVTDSLNSLAAALNASTNTAISSATYSVSGSALTITAKAGGINEQDFQLDVRNVAAAIGGTAQGWANAVNSSAVNAPDLGSYQTVFAVALGAANVTDVVVNAAPTAAQGLIIGGTLNATVSTIVLPLVTTVAGDSLSTITDRINAGTSTHGITAQIIGQSGAYNIQLRHNNPDLDQQNAAAGGGDITITGTVIAGLNRNNLGAVTAASAVANTIHVQATGLGGGGKTGISAGDTVGVGSIGNNLVTAQNQTKSVVRVLFPPIASANLNATLAPSLANSIQIQIGDPTSSAAVLPQPTEYATFTFSTNSVADAASTEISIGATLEETIDNAASAINKFVGTGVNNYDLNQVRAYRDGQNLVIESTDYGATRHLDIGAAGTPLAAVGIALNPPAAAVAAGVSVTNSGNLSNGTTGGISASNVTNKDFIGKISGFSATHTGAANTVNASVTVGAYTYSASAINTLPSANTTVRFSAENGGFFDVQLSANNGSAVNSQGDATTFAARLNAAFSTVNFYQNRDVSSYKGADPIVTDGVVTGSLLGSKVKIQGTNFDSVKIENIAVNAPLGSSPNGSIDFTINGEKFSSLLALGNKLGANQTYKFVSESDANRFVEFTTGNSAIDFGTAAKATSFQKSLETAFGVGAGNEALSFQVGVNSTDSLSVSLQGVTTSTIGTSTLDVLTQASAALATDALDAALDAVTAVRAEVGALQSRFNFAAANVESSIANQDAARGVLLDTDIAAESTSFATAQVQLQAGIAVLAQANLLPQNLLKLIG